MGRDLGKLLIMKTYEDRYMVLILKLYFDCSEWQLTRYSRENTIDAYSPETDTIYMVRLAKSMMINHSINEPIVCIMSTRTDFISRSLGKGKVIPVTGHEGP
jgi:hypothetical protein